MLDLRAIAHALGGQVSGREVLCPTPGHSRSDRGTAIRLAPGAPDGLLVTCFNGGRADALAVKDALRAAGILPAFDGRVRTITASERDAMRRAEAERLTERLTAQAKAAGIARQMLAGALPSDPGHSYLSAKRIGSEGLFQGTDAYGYAGALLVPMFDQAGRVWNVQSIVPGRNPSKLYVKGARTKGLFWQVGKVVDRLVIGEGMATVAAVRRATGLPVIAAMTCHNLPDIAAMVRAQRHDLQIIIAADDDDAGMKAARIAAEQSGATLALPEFHP